MKRWLQADQIKPWQYRSWQQPTDPRFLEKAIPILELYERAQSLSRKGHIIVCADEKTSIQARKAEGRTIPAGRGHAVHVGDGYQRKGGLPFDVRIHWLPVHASWLDQIEIVFSVLQRKVLMPNDFASPHHVERHMLAFLAERNRTARPIHWSYTSKQLMARFGRRQRVAAS